MQQLITAVCFFIIGFIMDDLLQDEEQEYLILSMTASPVAGIIFYRLLLLVSISQNSKLEKANWSKYTAFALLMPWKTDFYEMLTLTLNVGDDDEVTKSLLSAPQSGKTVEFYYN
jgi:hypothetical protein